MIRRHAAVIAAVLFAFAARASNGRTFAPQAVPIAKLQQGEAQARTKAAAELAAAARFAVSVSAVHEARAAFASALALTPLDAKLWKDVEALRKKKDNPSKDGLAQMAERRTKALAKCVEILSPAVAAYAEADRSDELARLTALMRAQAMPVDPLIAKYELVFFEPYADWRRKKDVERLTKGWEIVDGAWCDPAKVATLDAAHTTWSDPWKIADDVHEVRTTLPLRTARRILASVASFRSFLLGYIGLEMDLRPPPKKLPVILTATRVEMDQRMREFPGADQKATEAAAIYFNATSVGNPCFVSFEMKSADGKLMKVSEAGLRTPLLHEITHQILFEYSKHAANLKRLSQFDPWVYEGIAEFMPNYRLVDGAWVLHHPSGIPVAEGVEIEGAFGWCHDHADKLQPLKDFVAITLDQMNTVDNYHIACVLASNLLEGKERAYRSAFCDLAEQVHQARERADSFATCFKGVDLNVLDTEFRAYCKEIKVDTK